jgi:rubredoxin
MVDIPRINFFAQHRYRENWPFMDGTREFTMAKPEEMYQCQTVNCGCIYDPDRGDRKGKIPKGTAFDQTPEDWRCPACGASKKCFKPLAGLGSVKESH